MNVYVLPTIAHLTNMACLDLPVSQVRRNDVAGIIRIDGRAKLERPCSCRYQFLITKINYIEAAS